MHHSNTNDVVPGVSAVNFKHILHIALLSTVLVSDKFILSIYEKNIAPWARKIFQKTSSN